MDAKKYAKLFLFIFSTLTISFAGCKSDGTRQNENSPSETVSRFNTAVLAKNYTKALKQTDIEEDEYALYEAWLGMMFDELGNASLDVVSENVAADGNSAMVKVKLTNGKTNDTIYTETIKRDGVWKVRLASDF